MFTPWFQIIYHICSCKNHFGSCTHFIRCCWCTVFIYVKGSLWHLQNSYKFIPIIEIISYTSDCIKKFPYAIYTTNQLFIVDSSDIAEFFISQLIISCFQIIFYTCSSKSLSQQLFTYINSYLCILVIYLSIICHSCLYHSFYLFFILVCGV